MEYLITESQKKSLEELTAAGSWGKTDVDEKMFNEIIGKIGEKKSVVLAREYFENVIGKDVSEISDDLIYDYLSNPRPMYNSEYKKPKYFKNADVISGLGYFLFKKVFKLKKGNYGLEYYQNKGMFGDEYYFFDETLELSIGYMSTSEFKRGYRNKIYSKFPKGTKQVSLSMIDDKLIGLGYGKNMYLTVIDTVSCLMSDEVLYKGSLNMWINVIPKYAAYAGYISADKQVFKLPTKYKLDYKDIDCFFASKNANLSKTLK